MLTPEIERDGAAHFSRSCPWRHPLRIRLLEQGMTRQELIDAETYADGLHDFL